MVIFVSSYGWDDDDEEDDAEAEAEAVATLLRREDDFAPACDECDGASLVLLVVFGGNEYCSIGGK